jgi:hypothetical protein
MKSITNVIELVSNIRNFKAYILIMGCIKIERYKRILIFILNFDVSLKDFAFLKQNIILFSIITQGAE